jgi:hypothetical protein
MKRKALLKENVTIVHGGVTSFTETGCTSEDGTSYRGEVIICATGFDTSYIPHYPVIGPNNRNMQEEWANDIGSYMGVAASEFPNMFMFLGPHSPVSNGPTLVAIGMTAMTYPQLAAPCTVPPLRRSPHLKAPAKAGDCISLVSRSTSRLHSILHRPLPNRAHPQSRSESQCRSRLQRVRCHLHAAYRLDRRLPLVAQQSHDKRPHPDDLAGQHAALPRSDAGATRRRLGHRIHRQPLLLVGQRHQSDGMGPDERSGVLYQGYG